MAVSVMQAANNPTIRMSDRRDRFSFRDTGLSDRTVKVLLACGIDVPKRLLSMTPAEIAIIPGVGKISLGEIIRYRAWQLEIPSMAAAEHQPSCFALEEEKGGGWKRSGAMGPGH
jgi:DNA-directed RNA polymerase alpha subunit